MLVNNINKYKIEIDEKLGKGLNFRSLNYTQITSRIGVYTLPERVSGKVLNYWPTDQRIKLTSVKGLPLSLERLPTRSAMVMASSLIYF